METEDQKNDARKDDAAGEKNQSWQKRYLPVIDSIISFFGIAAVVWGVYVARATLVSIDKSVALAEESVQAQIQQLALAQEQFMETRDVLWLDQRPWLAFSRAETVPHEIGQDGGSTFRLHIFNSGKTPAFNVRSFQSSVEVNPNTHVFSEPSTWILSSLASMKSIRMNASETLSIFPNSTVYYNISIPPIAPSRFEPYTKEDSYLAVAARLEYCDANRSLHWTQLGVAKVFSETELIIQHSTASLHPGEPDHPDCRDEAPASN